MREILFRAWWKDGGGLVDQNDYVIRPNGTVEFPEGGWDLWGSDDSHLVVLEQFTGLHDATKWEDLTDAERDEWIKSGHTKEDWKGRRIFEGDILLTNGMDGKLLWVSYFDDEEAQFDFCPLGHEYCSTHNELYYSSKRQIIGNIHDQKEGI